MKPIQPILRTTVQDGHATITRAEPLRFYRIHQPVARAFDPRLRMASVAKVPLFELPHEEQP